MRQLLDFFELLADAGGREGQDIAWELVEVSMRSPLRATAQAVPIKPGVSAQTIARREKAAVAHSIATLTESGRVPSWMSSETRARARRLFLRNLGGVGRTDILFDPTSPPIVVAQVTARVAVDAIDRQDREDVAQTIDLSRIEAGSIEAEVRDATTYRGRPAIRVAERLSGDDVVCVFSQELAKKVGERNWFDVWANRRVLLIGDLTFNAIGKLVRVDAIDLEDINAAALTYQDIADPSFTAGQSIADHLSSIWRD